MKMKKSIALVVSLILVLTVTVGGTLAFLITKSGPVNNIFNPSKVTTSVEETIEEQVKKNVKIKNTGDTDAYIRAAVIVTWQNQAGEVYGTAPVAGTNYTNWTPGTDWVKGADGFYYYTKPVAPNTSTATALIAEIAPIGNPPANDYFLCVEILGSGIQSLPTSVVEDNWGVTVADDGTISK